MAPSPSTNGATTSVQVAVRIRPPTNHDSTSIPARFQRTVINAVSPTVVSIDATPSAPQSVGSSGAPAASPSSSASGKKQSFTFDQVHGPSSTQHSLFTSTAQPLIEHFVEGFNCTILAYGQTSSGKTFTMTGIDLDADPMDPSNLMGIIPRAISHIFMRCRELKDERGTAWNYSLKGSFIEIYNEDLIDLLSGDEGGSKTLVQIREDKQGHILWEGLREVNVKNSGEVMNLIRQGTSIRRTNETDMNAQSSRSHAIFSLTLTQKKYTGSGPPPRSSSPLPPNGRSPSRLARPSSTMYGGAAAAAGARVGSPTFGRPGTPSFTSAIGRGGAARPGSSMGMLTADHGRRHSLAPGGSAQQANGAEGDGEWVTVVSKFHFVDLAGSERLKRTAAAGERIKEGISINSGLLALGNVISALGDPSRAKSNTASYIPYRDSKLTRLLQDSLGGNAHTLMIACVSPAEWNANETVNTLKYANRARNIKNRAVVNEKEDGWDDVEWLQAQVTRLRKEVKGLKEGGAHTLSTIGESEVAEQMSPSKKTHAQVVELRNNYEEMREKYMERTEELTRLRRELAEKQRASGGAVGGTAKYEEIVGPVIEEYEKTISAMEAELSLNRAALRHTNDLVDEKEVELNQLAERHATTEMYVAELRARVAKLSEREQSTEAYIRDLEEKVKLFNEDSLSSSGSITDLKRELSKFRDTESHSSQYIIDLEARLAKSDESVLSLQQSVERLEADCEARREEVRLLEARLENIQRDGEGWRSDLEEREQKIQKMEAELREREEALKVAAETRERLGIIVNDVSEARKNLEVASIASNKSEVSSINEPENTAEAQLIALQQTHTATLADLSSVSAKYRDALREIADLAAQLQEAKVNASIPPTPLSESPERPAEASSPRRRMVRGASRDGADVQFNGSSRRLLYRHPASMESLHTRSASHSVSLSQELSSARSRKASISSHSTSSSVSHSSHHSRPNLSLNVSPHERSVQSLEQEIMRLQEVLKERENEITVLEQSLSEKERAEKTSSVVDGLPGPSAEIVMNGDSHLGVNLSPKTMNQFQELRHTLDGIPSPSDDSSQRLNELMRSMAQKEEAHREAVDKLHAELGQVRRHHDELTVLSRDQALNMSNEIEGLHVKHTEDLAKLEELERREAELSGSLQQAQAEHASAVETLKAEHEEALRVKSAEVDALLTRTKSEHEEALRAKSAEVDAILIRTKAEHDSAFQTLCDQLADASAQLETARREHEEAFGSLKAEHEEELKKRSEEVVKTLESARAEHAAHLQEALQKHEAELKEALEKHQAELADVVAKHQAEHDETLRQRGDEHTAAIDQIRKEYDDAIVKLISDHQESVKRKEEQASSTLQRTEEEYYEALVKLRQDHAQALEKQAADAATVLERLKDEHARALQFAEIAREGSLTQTQSAQEQALKELQDAHAAAIANKESNFTTDLQKLKDEHTELLASKEEQHRSNVQRLKADHSAVLHENELAHTEALEKLQTEHTRILTSQADAHKAELSQLTEAHATEIKKLREDAEAEAARLTAELERTREDHSSATAALKELEESLQQTKEQHATVLGEVERAHEEKVSQLQAGHESTLATVLSEAAEKHSSTAAEHAEEIARLQAEHQAALEATQSELAATQEQHKQALDESREQTDRLLAKEKSRLESSLSDFENQHNSLAASHAQEIARLKAEHHAALAAAQSDLIDAQEQHRLALEESRAQTERLLAEEKARLTASLSDLEQQQNEEIVTLRRDIDLLQVEKSKLAESLSQIEAQHADETMTLQEQLETEQALRARTIADLDSRHAAERAVLQQERDMLQDELESHKAAADEHVVAREETRQKYESMLREKTDLLDSLHEDLSAVHAERDELAAIVSQLRSELDDTRNKTSALVTEASKRESLVEELEKHRSVLAEMQENLQKTKDEMDTLQAEKNKQDSILRDLQTQLTRSPSPGTSRLGASRPNGIPAPKLPPLTPLPSPPTAIPPTLKSMHEPHGSTSSSGPMSPSSARSIDFSDNASTPATSVAGSTLPGGADPKLVAQVQEQAKQLEEQETMIKTLNKQLTHCESDLQAHMDMVATLETSLADAEKNLRKARMQATEIARERDNLTTQITTLRQELHEAKVEVVNVRKSVVEEKQTLESRLDEERRAKERARQQLDTRMDELQRRKSKFACL
ncbi:kinesin-domain-containing protein [Trametopsis cervina]|nr:kinesin-domain-containing protein [Trametopsis cervina]